MDSQGAGDRAGGFTFREQAAHKLKVLGIELGRPSEADAALLSFGGDGAGHSRIRARSNSAISARTAMIIWSISALRALTLPLYV